MTLEEKLTRSRAAGMAVVEAQVAWYQARAEHGRESAEASAAIDRLGAANRDAQRAWDRVRNAVREQEMGPAPQEASRKSR